MTVTRNDSAAVGWSGGGGGGGGGGTVGSITPVNPDMVIGRSSPGAGPAEEIPFTAAARTLCALGTLAGQKAYLGIVSPDATDYKDNVLVATTGNIALTGEQTIDGVLTSASRVLVWQQTLPAQNGIYVSAAGAWTRATDADTSLEVTSGLMVTVDQGTAYADQLFQLITPDPIVLNTTGLTFQSISLPPGLVAYKTVSTTSYTNILSDTNKRLLFTNAAPKTMIVAAQATVALAINTVIELYNGTAATLTVDGSAITLNAASLTVPFNSIGQLKKRANPNTWDLVVIPTGSGGVTLANTSQWTKNQSVAPVVLTGTAVAPTTDASLSNVFTKTLTANATLQNPTNLVHGMHLTWIIDNGTNPYTLAYGTMFKWGKGGLDNAPILSTTASKVHVITGVYDSASGFIYAGMIDTLTVTAPTKTWDTFNFVDFQPPATNFASFDTRNSRACYSFDDTTDESILISGKVPQGALTTPSIRVYIEFKAATATSGQVKWEAAFEKGNTDSDADSFDTATANWTATNATSGISTTLTLTCSTIDGIVAGDPYILKISRKPSDTTNDTMVGDAQLFSVEVQGF
jgi:hypothetical protein